MAGTETANGVIQIGCLGYDCPWGQFIDSVHDCIAQGASLEDAETSTREWCSEELRTARQLGLNVRGCGILDAPVALALERGGEQ